MNFPEKIIYLRKKNGLSQEDLAEKLNVSRQAVSRWEQGSAMPDAANIMAISRLFSVSADRLLDDTQSPDRAKPYSPPQENNLGRIMIYMVTIEVMAAFIQFMSVFILQNTFFAFLSFVPFIAIIGGFEYAYRKNSCNETSARFRRKFYKISAWIGLYFPVRFAVTAALTLYPRPYTVLLKECIICVVYITAATITNLNTDREYAKK